jgi:hypothetical protein
MAGDVRKMAEQLLADIATLQGELGVPAASAQSGLAVPRISIEEARRLKAAVDMFRMFLWAYLDSWESKQDVQAKLRNIRMDCVSDMIAVLHRDFREHGVPANPSAERIWLEVGRMAELLNAAPPVRD